MDYLLATSNKQLGICLRMLFAEGIQGSVKTVLNSRDKIEFHITANVDKEKFNELAEHYKVLIS